jgi:hypothetical protein
VFTDVVGGTGDSFTAATYDVFNHKRLRTTSACDADEEAAAALVPMD